MATAPSLVAETDDKEPLKLPIGVRTAAAITTSLVMMRMKLQNYNPKREYGYVEES
jgi:hypothetical protein